MSDTKDAAELIRALTFALAELCGRHEIDPDSIVVDKAGVKTTVSELLTEGLAYFEASTRQN